MKDDDFSDLNDESDDEEITGEKTVITKIKSVENKKHAYIIFLSGPMMGKLHLLEEGEIVIGRGKEADVVINDPGISRKHAGIRLKKDKAYLSDLGSTNGTYLNERRIQKDTELQDGDRIQISSATIIKYAYQDHIENVFHEELYKMAVVDALTGAYNKRYFEERMNEEFSYCFRNGVPLSLLMLDIDHFKKINDTYGHPAGDAVLARISALAKTIIRNEDILARYGGEEFVIVLKGTDSNGAFTLAERLRALIDGSIIDFEEKNLHVTVSIGIATLEDQNIGDWQEMFRTADTLLYKSKHAGRNRVSA